MPDLVITHSELSSTQLPISFKGTQKETDSPSVDVSYTTDGETWHAITIESRQLMGAWQQLTPVQVQLPGLPVRPELQWIIVKARLSLPVFYQRLAIIAVLPDSSSVQAVAYDIDQTLAVIPRGRK